MIDTLQQRRANLKPSQSSPKGYCGSLNRGEWTLGSEESWAQKQSQSRRGIAETWVSMEWHQRLETENLSHSSPTLRMYLSLRNFETSMCTDRHGSCDTAFQQVHIFWMERSSTLRPNKSQSDTPLTKVNHSWHLWVSLSSSRQRHTPW